MSDAVERLVNLALFLAASRSPLSARQIREEVEGYPRDQDEEAFLRMFERDKKELRAAGLVIETMDLPAGRAYRLDHAATFQQPLALSAADAALLRAAGAALADDPGFPFAGPLVTALAKLAASPTVAIPGFLADEDAPAQGALAAELARAAVTRKRASFVYETADGRVADRTVEPYGLFLRDGRWYLVGRPSEGESVDPRVFAVRRMQNLTVNTSRPGTPDFQVPEAFEPYDYARLPFQFGEAAFQTTLEFAADLAWRAPLLAEGHGSLSQAPDGAVRWTVQAADPARLARWVIENGPGIRLLEPAMACSVLTAGLTQVATEHA